MYLILNLVITRKIKFWGMKICKELYIYQNAMFFSDTTKITEDEIKRLENLVNEKIRQGLAVTVTVYKTGYPYLVKVLFVFILN